MTGDTAIRARRRRAAWLLILAVPGLIVLAVVVGLLTEGGEPGALEERLLVLGPDTVLPRFTDATASTGLADWTNTSKSQVSGGIASGDIDGDGWPDVVVAGGDLGVFFGSDTGAFSPADGSLRIGRDAVSVAFGDLDGDGSEDLVVGRWGADDVVVWGGPWTETRDLAVAATATLAGTSVTSSVAVAELSGDGRADVVRLGYGDAGPENDLVLSATDGREFQATELPNSDRRSLAVATTDVDGDGLLDVWITRDVGWIDGGDSIYSRVGDRGGGWVDVAPDYGANIEVDGMGITIADLDGDGLMDGYVSDIGDNEVLRRAGDVFEPVPALGIGRIRPPGAADHLVSSSWSSGVADLNLDGLSDLVLVNGGFPAGGVINKIPNTSIPVSDTPALFIASPSGGFADVWSKLNLEWEGAGRGLTIVDYDRDGDADLFVSSADAGLAVYRNETAAPSLRIVAGVGCPTAGTEVHVTGPSAASAAQLRGTSFLGHHAAEVIVGGVPGVREVVVRWPNGATTTARPTLGTERSTVEMNCDSTR